jgi:hypothetical protein
MSLSCQSLGIGSIYQLPDLLALKQGLRTSLFVQPVTHVSEIRKRKVTSCYIAVLPPEPAAAEPNQWVLVLETADRNMMLVELRQADPQGRTVVVCREAQTSRLGTYAKSWLLTIRQGSVVGDWLDILEISGLTKYQLNAGCGEQAKGRRMEWNADKGTGGRWWLDCVLTQFRSFFAAGYDDAKVWLRLAWNGTGEPVHDGLMQNLRKGVWV